MYKVIKVSRKQVVLYLQMISLASIVTGVYANPFVNKSILMVDDREATRTTFKNLFRLFGFTDVVVAEHGDEALQIVRKRDSNFDIVFTDREMGLHMDGIELAKALRGLRVSSKIYLHSGNPPAGDVELELFDRVFVKGTNLDVIKSEMMTALQSVEEKLMKDPGGMICTEEFQVSGRDAYRFERK
jgi:CheY-like chemotaxis protein